MSIPLLVEMAALTPLIEEPCDKNGLFLVSSGECRRGRPLGLYYGKISRLSIFNKQYQSGLPYGVAELFYSMHGFRTHSVLLTKPPIEIRASWLISKGLRQKVSF